MAEPKYKITFAARASTKQFEEKEFTLEGLIKLLSLHNPRGDKDGGLFMPGRIVGGKRAATAVPEINCLIYDIDGTNSVQEVEDILVKAGVKAIVYTTFNHGRSVSYVVTDAYDKWAKRAGAKTTPDLASMLEYLAFTKKTHLANVVFEGETEHVGGGICYKIKHDPEDKLRVVFPLGDKPIVLAKLSKLTAVAVDTYKAIYHGVGQALGLKYDEACSDPCRLHYLPGHLTGSTGHFVRMYDGPLLDYTVYPRSHRTSQDYKTNPDGTTSKKSPADYICYDKNNRRIDLRAWDLKNRDTFDIEGMLQNCLPPEMIRPRPGKDGITITCPFEHDHTEKGGDGTFAAPPKDDGNPWTIWCAHTTCQNIEGRKRLDYLKQFILDGYVTAEDLGIPKLKETPPSPEPDTIERVFENAGIDLDTLPGGAFEKFNDKLSVLSSIEDKTEALLKLEEALKEARYTNHLVDSVRAVVKGGVSILPEELARMVAGSMADMSSIKQFAKLLYDVVKITPTEFEGLVKITRDEGYQRAVGDLVTDQLVGRERETALQKLANFYGKKLTEVRSLYGEQSRMVKEHEEAELIIKHMEMLTRTYAKVHTGSSTMFIDMIESLETGIPKLHSKDSLSLTYSNFGVEAWKEDKKGNKKAKTENIFNAWNTRCPDIKVFKGLTFNPNEPTETLDGKFNVWAGIRMQPMEGDASPILNHLKNIWCAGDERDFNWLQLYIWDIFHNPGKKPHSSVVVLGGQGTGKSIVFEHALAHMLNPYYVQSANPKDLQGNFNAFAENKLVFYADEALFAGDKGAASYLKGKIAQDTLRIERKGVDTYIVPHFTRYFFTSNSEHALHVDSDDRRYFVLRTTDEQKQNTEYFENLREWLTQKNGCRFWLNHIMRWKPEEHGMKRSDLFNPPSTEAKRGQINQSIDPASEFFMEFLKYGRLVSIGDAIPMPPGLSWPLDSELVTQNEHLRNAFQNYLRFVAGGAARFERSKYTELFKKYFGKAPSALSRTVREGPKTHKRLVLPARQDVLANLYALRLIDEDTYNEALESVDSHIPPYDLD